jgi:hypothetical protein
VIKEETNLCFLSNGMGSVFYLYPLITYLKKKKINHHVFCDRNTKKFWTKKNIKTQNINNQNYRWLLKYKIIISSAVIGNDIEKKIILQKTNQYIIQFIDGWSFIEKRFKYKKSNVFPNEIWCNDNLVKGEIKKLSEHSKIITTGHPGFEQVLKIKSKKRNKKKKILVVLQPLKKIDQFSFNEHDMIKFFSKKFFKKNYNLDFAMHPDHKNFNFHKYQNVIKLNSESQILKYDYVISYFSTLLLLSLCCGIRSSVFSLNKKKFQFKNFKKFGLEFSNNLDDIKNFLFSRLYKNNNKLKKIHFFSTKRIFNRIQKKLQKI